jgi:hypothetical protein
MQCLRSLVASALVLFALFIASKVSSRRLVLENRRNATLASVELHLVGASCREGFELSSRQLAYVYDEASKLSARLHRPETTSTGSKRLVVKCICHVCQPP